MSQDIDENVGTLQERLLLILSICLVPFLIFASINAYFEAREQRENRRRAIALEVEQSIDRVEAEIASARTLLELFSPQLVADQCGVVFERLEETLPSLETIVSYQDRGDVCLAGEKTSPALVEAKINKAGGAQTGSALLVADGSDLDPPNRQVVVWYQFDGAYTVFLMNLDRSLRETVSREGDGIPMITLIDQYGTTYGSLQSIKLASGWLEGTDISRNSDIKTYTDDNGVVYDIVISPMSTLGLFAVAAERQLSLWHPTRLSPVTSVGVPLAVFVVALLAVWISVDRMILRWFRSLRRMAAAYAGGRYDYQPNTDFARAPSEIERFSSTMTRMAKRIGERDQELRDAIAVKDDAVKEIHHRVKNNLQIVNSFIGLQCRSMRSPEAKNALTDVKHRIDALSIVHQTLYQHERLEIVALQPFLGCLLEHLEEALGLQNNNISMKWTIDAVDRPSDDAIPLALFILEAVTNSTKYAFDQRGGTIEVALVLLENQLALTIEDQRYGSKPQTNDDSSTGLGGKLMKAFSRQVKGAFTTEEMPRGYKVVLTMPH